MSGLRRVQVEFLVAVKFVSVDEENADSAGGTRTNGVAAWEGLPRPSK